MKVIKLSLVIMAAALLTIGLGGMAYAFHDGGVAYCEGCHTMHNSLNGVKMTKYGSTTIGTANNYLLQASDQSSTCLSCHGSSSTGGYHILDTAAAATNPPRNYTAGGDFGWLKATYSWTLPRSGSSLKDSHGHNIVANDFTLGVDSRFSTGAPGGSYPRDKLGCHSCHDPHGKYRIVDTAGTIAVPSIGAAVLPIGGYGSYGAMPTADQAVGVYRLLAGKGYTPKSLGTNAFVNDPPIAVSPSSYNAPESPNDTRVAYGSGMSQWCANCHGGTDGASGFHNSAYPANLRHPSGMKLTSVEIANYNHYVKSGDLSGTVANAYTSLVPFEEGTTDRAALTTHAVLDGSQKGGADANSTVMCLSCHRAHASAWDSMGRWNFRATFLTVENAYPGTDAPTQEGKDNAQGRTQAEWKAGMNGRPASAFAYVQRSLCNKCHAKD